MRYRVGAKCVVDLAWPMRGVVSRTPYKRAGEWWVNVDVQSEQAYDNGYFPCRYTVRCLKRRVTQLRGRNVQR